MPEHSNDREARLKAPTDVVALMMSLPFCYYCGIATYNTSSRTRLARFDAIGPDGRWAYMCTYHFRLLAKYQTLGAGRGQMLITETEWMQMEGDNVGV